MAVSKVVQFPTPTTLSSTQNETKSKYKRRKDGLYQVEFRYTDQAGKACKKSFYGKTQQEAKEKRKAFEKLFDVGIRPEKVMVKEYTEQWLTTYKCDLKPATLVSYKVDTQIIVDAIGQKEIKTVTASDVQQIINGRADKSASAIKKLSMTLKAIFESARMDRLISFNPCDRLVLPKGHAGTHKLLDMDTVTFITTQNTDHRMYVAAMLMLYAGLRRGEVLAFNLDRDVDFETQELHVRESVYFDNGTPLIGGTKSKAGIRTIPILGSLYGILEGRKGQGLAFTSATTGKLATETAFKKAWWSYLYALEVTLNGVRKRWATDEQKEKWHTVDIQCHDLRHTFCSMLHDAGVDVKTAQLWMGHSDPMVTMRIYTHLSQEKNKTSTKAAKKYFDKLSVNKSVKP